MDYKKLSIENHKKFKGKVGIYSKVPLENKDDLSTYYSPGVAEPCLEIQKDNALAYEYTWKSNSLAVVSDGSAVLGLGNIGGIAGLPVMEGKAILFKKYGNIDAIPIVLSTQNPDEIINIIKNISPTFGGINLEDIKAPECFYIEEKLINMLDIPVFHDDQHGTAIVVLAGLINSLKLIGKQKEKMKIVISGAGASGIATANLLNNYGFLNIVMLDSKGVIFEGRDNLNEYKKRISKLNINNQKGNLKDVIKGADVFIGLSQPGVLKSSDIETMNPKSIVFALANPTPEIFPDEAKKGGALIVATGRSDFPNQVNNVLAFPGIFRGAFDGKIRKIETKHKINSAIALADYISDLNYDYIIPSALDLNVAKVIANAVINTK